MYELYVEILNTFVNWTSEFPESELALAGFIYTNQDDIVYCPMCGIEGCDWLADDDPTPDHLKWSPNCPFFNENEIQRFIVKKEVHVIQIK